MEYENFKKCKHCHGGMYYVSDGNGGRPPDFCSDECKHEHQLIKQREYKLRRKKQTQYQQEVAEIIRPKGIKKNKSIDDILLELKAEGKGPEAFAEYKRKKALENVTPIIL